MGKFFSDEVELALNYLYYGMTGGGTNPEEALRILNEAVEKDDMDAMFLLSVCYSGIWKGHGIVPDKKADFLLKKAILGGSSIALIGGVGVAGLMDDYDIRSYVNSKTLKVAFDKVYKMAEDGEAFCQYLIASAMTWEDTFFVQEVDSEHPNFARAYINYKLEAINWFRHSFENGIYAAGNSLIAIYNKGITGVISANKLKRKEIITYGAETLKNIEFMYDYYGFLRDRGDDQAAFEYTLKGMEGGDKRTFYRLGLLYMNGVGTEVNYEKALECFENALSFVYEDMQKQIYGFLGQIHAAGNNGVTKNNRKAVTYYIMADELDNTIKNDECALLLVLGDGCKTDYKKAMELLERFLNNNKPTNVSNYCQGIMYVEGLGYAQDIKKGMRYLKNVNIMEAQNKKSEFKRNLFGKWKRVKKATPKIEQEHIEEDAPIEELVGGIIIGAVAAEAIDNLNSEEIVEPVEASFNEETAQPAEADFNEDVSAPVEINFNEETEQPVEINFNEDASAPVEINFSEDTEQPIEINFSEETEQPIEINFNEDVSAPVEINFSEETEQPIEINFNEETEQPIEINFNEETEQPIEINFNEETEQPIEINFNKEASAPVDLDFNAETAQPVELDFNEKNAQSVKINFNEDVSAEVEINFNEEVSAPVKINFNEEVSAPVEINFNEEVSAPVEIDINEETAQPVEINFNEETEQPVDLDFNEEMKEVAKLDSNEEITTLAELDFNEEIAEPVDLDFNEKIEGTEQKDKKKTGSIEYSKEENSDSVERDLAEELINEPVELEFLEEISELIEMDLPEDKTPEPIKEVNEDTASKAVKLIKDIFNPAEYQRKMQETTEDKHEPVGPIA